MARLTDSYNIQEVYILLGPFTQTCVYGWVQFDKMQRQRYDESVYILRSQWWRKATWNVHIEWNYPDLWVINTLSKDLVYGVIV